MKQLFTACLLLFVTASFSQVWQSIGTAQGSTVTSQDITIDQSNGDLYMAYTETGVTKTTVKKWSGTTWQAVGNVNFGPTATNHLEVRIQVINGNPYVAIKFINAGLYYIRVYRLSTTWQAMGSTAYQTNNTDDWAFKISPAGDLYLTYFNMTSSVGSLNELITLGISNTSQGQIGGYISDSFVDNMDMVIDADDQIWVSHEYGDMSNYVNLSYSAYPDYITTDQILNDWSGKIVTNLVDNYYDLRFASVVDDASLGTRRYDLGTGTPGTLTTIYAAAPNDYDMASDATYDYFFLTAGTTVHYAMRVSSTGTNTILGTNFGTGTGTPTFPKVETWNDRVVVSYVRGSSVRVMELDNPATMTLANEYGVCEQTLTTTAAFTLNDNNYSHAGLTVSVNSTDGLTSPAPTLVGSYPNYFLQFTSIDIASNTQAEFEFETYENSVNTNYELFYVDIDAYPSITLSLPTALDEVCENHAVINLTPYGSPAGGFWSGPGVNSATGKFNPDVANPGSHTINYSYTTPHGCVNDDNIVITVNPVPQVTVSTTVATCGSDDGTANATITGGTPAYTIYWSNGSNIEDQTDLAPGMYYINVTDTKGCQSIKPATITSNGLTLAGTPTNVNCPGASTGSIDFSASSLSGIQSYAWSNGATTEDVSGLHAGTYEVTVTANDGCVSTASFEVTSPAPLATSASTVPATCASTDGSATCNVTGGTAPYNFQWFETLSGAPIGTNSPTISGFGGGGYFAIVTDDNGCSAIHNTMISEVGGPEVLISSVTPAGCADDGAINISIITDQPISLLEWSNGETTEDISDLTPGFYTVEITDEDGCMGMGGVEVPAASPDQLLICLVTVDTATNTNLLVWEKPTTTDIDHFNIYRETSVAGEFLLIASVPYADESVYNDLVASPQVRSWRYKITAVNLCGEESDMSEFHKTIHLTINIGLGGLINLNWDAYEGFPFPTYDLYRHTNSDGWILLQSMPSNLFSYADTPPSMNGLDYIIAVSPPDTCTSTLLKVQDHNSSRSNKSSSITGELMSINEQEDATGTTLVYPNPSTGTFNVYVTAEEVTGFNAIVTDAQGRVIMQFSSNQELAVIDLSDFSDGVYNLQILVDDTVINRKLIKQ